MTNQREELNIRNTLTICIAIPTYNRERVLVDTIKQVLAQNLPADEVLVIDQTELHEPETEEYLSRMDSSGQIKWVKQYPPNLPAARNRALALTKCDILLFIDDDVEMSSDFVERHRNNYFDLKVCAVAGRIIQPWSYLFNKKKWPRIMDYRFFPLDFTMRVEGIANFGGGNHSVRVHALAEIGGYDTNYIGWAYREDSDAAIRLWKTGRCVVFDPEAKLTHLAVPSGGCRLKGGNKSLPEWQISFPATYFAMRHLFPNRWFWHDVLIGNVRRYVLRKDNVFQPWKLPWATLSYTYSIAKAFFRIKFRSRVDGHNV